MAGTTTTSAIGAGVNTYYDKRLMRMISQNLRLIPFGQKRPLPEGDGTTIEFFRWLAFAKVLPTTAAGSGGRLLTEGTNPTAIVALGQKVSKAIAEYGAFVSPTSLAKQSHIDAGLKGLVDIMALDASNAMDILAWLEIAGKGHYPITADRDATVEYDGVLGTITSTTVISGGAALEANAAYGGTDDDLNQSVIVITSGKAQGQSRPIVDYDADGASTGTAISGRMTVSPAFSMTPTAGDAFHICSGDNLAAGDHLDFENLKKARAILKTYDARYYSGNTYVSLVNPEQVQGLMDDTKWQALAQYTARTNAMFDGELGMYAGVRFIENTNNFNFPTHNTLEQNNTTYGPGALGANWTASSGATSVGIYATIVPVFGRDCFGVSTFAQKMGQARRPRVITKYPGPGDTSNPLNMFHTVGWKLEACVQALQALHCVGIWCSSS